jgi:hypothetical protein
VRERERRGRKRERERDKSGKHIELLPIILKDDDLIN